MTTQTMVVIDRAELRKESLRLSARLNVLVGNMETFEDFNDFSRDRVLKHLKDMEEYGRLGGVIDFIRALLKEEEVNPEDYGVPCVTIG